MIWVYEKMIHGSGLTRLFVLGILLFWGCEKSTHEDEFETIILDNVFAQEILSYVDQADSSRLKHRD